jgi:hypothetical protein
MGGGRLEAGRCELGSSPGREGKGLSLWPRTGDEALMLSTDNWRQEDVETNRNAEMESRGSRRTPGVWPKPWSDSCLNSKNRTQGQPAWRRGWVQFWTVETETPLEDHSVPGTNAQGRMRPGGRLASHQRSHSGYPEPCLRSQMEVWIYHWSLHFKVSGTYVKNLYFHLLFKNQKTWQLWTWISSITVIVSSLDASL